MLCVKFPDQTLKLFLAVILLTILTAPGNLVAAENIYIKSETIVRFLERDTVTKNDALVVPVYEYLQLDIGQEAISFHANGWGRADITDNDYFDDQTTGELLYGYLEYRPAGKNVYTRLGRQTIFAGVANESIDGIYLDMALPAAMTFSAYLGQPVSLNDTNGSNGDSIYGGRIGMRIATLDIGASYKLIENDNIDSEEMAGIDYGIMLNNLFVGGLTTYNLITEDFAEQSVDIVHSTGTNRLRLFYQVFIFADYFGTGANNANPFRVLALSSEELSSYGVEVTRGSSESSEIGIRLTRNDYDIEEASHYLALLANWTSEKNTYGGEFGFSEGESGRNDMLLARGYMLMNLGGNKILDQLGIDLLYAIYDESIFGEDTSLFASIYGSKQISDRLKLKLSTDYESNPYYDSDFRGLISVTYNYSSR